GDAGFFGSSELLCAYAELRLRTLWCLRARLALRVTDTLELCVELGTEQESQARQVKPEHQNRDRGQAAVEECIVAERRDVGAKSPGNEEECGHRHERPGPRAPAHSGFVLHRKAIEAGQTGHSEDQDRGHENDALPGGRQEARNAPAHGMRAFWRAMN